MVSPGMLISSRYEIIDKIGTGGMADVYKAKCHRLNRFVAIKILKPEFSEDDKFVDKFRAEAQSVAGLSHPNIVNVYDVGEDEDLHYIVMELVEGITLKSFIEKKGHLEVKEATGIAIQIARGMEAAHNNHIIHRDIKPQNIIISTEGKVKVTDFGIAKATTSNTITSNAMGSVYYISPEQARGGYSDEKSDIYSLGVTLYEMLTGQVPFSGETTVSVALSHIQEEPKSIRMINPNVPLSLERIVQKCMQKKAERRYLRADALIEDLKQSLTEPDGAFVQLVSAVVDDSPTVQFTEGEIKAIRDGASKKNVEDRPVSRTVKKVVPEPIEEEEDEVDPKLEKLMIGGGIATAIILILIILFLIGRFLGVFNGLGSSSQGEESHTGIEQEVENNGEADNTENNENNETGEDTNADSEENEDTTENQVADVPMIYVVGYTKAEAEAMLNRIGLKAEYKEEFSDTYEKGFVCEQSVARGTVLKEGDIVILTVSTGPENTIVPVVERKTKAAAESAFAEKKLKVASFEEEYSDTVEAGLVTRTVPAGGSTVSIDATVIVYLSKGPEIKLATVPKLTGKTEAEAMEALEAVGLKGSVSGKKHSELPIGQVLEQSHNYGVQVEVGTEITFVLSEGPEETYVYYGSITISDNPFMYEDEEGTISLVLTQDGKSWEVYKEVCTYADFPLNVSSIEGVSESIGEITMYCDNAKIGTYSISFQKVSQ